MFLVSSCSCLCPIHWSQVLSWERRCSWSSADRRCSNYIWVINNYIAYSGATYIRGFTVVIVVVVVVEVLVVVAAAAAAAVVVVVAAAAAAVAVVVVLVLVVVVVWFCWWSPEKHGHMVVLKSRFIPLGILTDRCNTSDIMFNNWRLTDHWPLAFSWRICTQDNLA